MFRALCSATASAMLQMTWLCLSAPMTISGFWIELLDKALSAMSFCTSCLTYILNDACFFGYEHRLQSVQQNLKLFYSNYYSLLSRHLLVPIFYRSLSKFLLLSCSMNFICQSYLPQAFTSFQCLQYSWKEEAFAASIYIFR